MPFLLLRSTLLFSLVLSSFCLKATSAPVVGVDFSSGASFNVTPDDLVPSDGITVSPWSFSGGGAILEDSSGGTNRASAPVGKLLGPTTIGTAPAIGSAPPTLGVHSFSITVDASMMINLTRVSFDFSPATIGRNRRWVAFRTSLDAGLLSSENGLPRPSWNSVDLALTDAKYQGLTNETITFYWYCGGEGTGDCDIDSIVIEAEAAASGPPVVMNLAASDIEAQTATLNGEVTDTGGAAPLVTYFYGTTDGGTDPAAWTNGVALGNEVATFSTDLTGLSPVTTYFYRAFAENNGGSDWADSSGSFTTNAIIPPSVINSPAINITGSAARVSGEVVETGGSLPSVTLFWGEQDGGTNAGAWDHILVLGPQDGVFLADLTGLAPTTQYFYRVAATNEAGLVWAPSSESFTTLAVQTLVINEFMAANDGGNRNNSNNWFPIANQVSGTTDDWIEIANRSAAPLSLAGWSLTDDPSDLTQWSFPAGTTVPANGYLIVYASGDGAPDANGNLHTNFGLSAGGDYLALVNPSFVTVSEFGLGGEDYPNQDDDISYGLHPVSELPVFFRSPTPGVANDATGLARVADTKFNIGRGYYDTVIDVEITSATLGATIYYTLDGDVPIDPAGNPSASAMVYAGAIPVTQTSTIRAAAVLAGMEPTNVDCNTYVLLDIENAAANGIDPAGLNTPFLLQTQPAGWGSLTSGDFNMDPNVSQSTALASGHASSTAQTMLEGMRDIPTISIVMNRDDFSGSNGIYTNSQSGGFDFERACSVEFIPAEDDVRDDWQENCGIRAQGGASRNPENSPKHGLSFRFREIYGVAKLREPVFPGSEVEEFDVLSVRAGYNNSWIHRDANQQARGSMIRDQWVRQTMLDMGHPSAGEGFMTHIFVNGLYWGVHNLVERADAGHYAEHNDADADFIDARNGSEFVNGNSIAFDQLDDVVATGDWQNIEQVLNVDQYIDYQLVNRYGGNADLKTTGNWRAAGGGPFPAGQPEEMAPWELYSWDAERTLESQTSTIVPLDPLGIRSALEALPDYQIRLADRVQRHFFGGGALTPSETQLRWMQYADDLDRAIIAESARWGDHRRATAYTRDVEWLTEQNRLYNTYFPVRTANVLSNLSLSPVLAPVYRVGGVLQAEGLIPSGSILSATGSGSIIYTIDGSDPRLDGGAISPNATTIVSGGTIPLSVGSLVKARVLNGSTWSALSEGTFFVGPLADASNVVVSEIMYNPAGSGEETEFIELLNIDPSNAIDLSLMSFEGINYTFPLGTSLLAGERIVVATDAVAFANAYNTAGINLAPGEFSSSLSNDGEEIALITAFGADAQRFTYNDAAPWPLVPDGAGFSLTLINPKDSPDHSLAVNWRSSVQLGGSPGGDDTILFTGDPLADDDGDGLSALFEYAVGSLAGDAGASPESSLMVDVSSFVNGAGGNADFLTLSYRRNLSAVGVDYQVQLSADLQTWSDMSSDLLSTTFNGDGTETITLRNLTPVVDEAKQFVRLRVTLLP